MSGINTSGTPNTQDYSLGRGAIYLAKLNTTTNLPDANGYRHVGNVPAFTITMEVETLEHQSSLHGLKVTDLSVILSQKVSFSFTFDEINFDNLALFFSGETGTFSNSVAIAGFAEWDAIPVVKLGRWYDITDNAGVRVYNITAANLTVESPNATTKTLGTDYLVDAVMGRVFFVSAADGGTIADGADVHLTLAANAGAGTVEEVKSLTQTNDRVALKFIGENPVNDDVMTEVQIHKTQLKADGDFSLIGDEFTTASLTGTAEANTDADADSPYVTIRTLTVAG